MDNQGEAGLLLLAAADIMVVLPAFLNFVRLLLEYYTTCLEAAVAFIMRMDTSQVTLSQSLLLGEGIGEEDEDIEMDEENDVVNGDSVRILNNIYHFVCL